MDKQQIVIQQHTLLTLTSIAFFIVLWTHSVMSTSDYSSGSDRIQSRGITSGKKILFPHGAKLTIKPSLEIPLLDDAEFHHKTFSTQFNMELPIKIELDKLGKYTFKKWMYLGQELLRQELDDDRNLADYHNSVFSPRSSSRRRLNQTQSYNHRSKRFIHDYQHQHQGHQHDERFHVLTKLENILHSLGWTPARDCLLRAICELHEYFTVPGGLGGQYNFDGYGLVGEIALLLLSVSKTTAMTQTVMQEHLNAEIAGVGGNCTKYVKMCKRSVFG